MLDINIVMMVQHGMYVSTGIFSVIIFVIMLLSFFNKNSTILSLLFPTMLTFLVEAGRTFFPYMLLIIAWFIIEGAKRERVTINAFVLNVFNNKK